EPWEAVSARTYLWCSLFSCLAFLSGLFERQMRLFADDHFLGDRQLLRIPRLRELIHQVQHQFLKYDAQAARSDIAADGSVRDGFESVIIKPQLDVLVLEEFLVLLDQRI